jgi:Rrf2 family transcriptional regulator, cysteine metabolism repressor
MMFSTKAEYGVRVMVELARRAGDDPVPLAEIAEHDGLPLAYLEHLVARLRKAGLVDSRRGSRGGYLLARAPAEITMAEVVEALEGSIAPIECISQAADGSIVCSRESDPGHVCPTKLLWTRVRFAIVSTLRETTLADLVLTPAPARASKPAAATMLPTDPLPTSPLPTSSLPTSPVPSGPALPAETAVPAGSAALAAIDREPLTREPLTTGA